MMTNLRVWTTWRSPLVQVLAQKCKPLHPVFPQARLQKGSACLFARSAAGPHVSCTLFSGQCHSLGPCLEHKCRQVLIAVRWYAPVRVNRPSACLCCMSEVHPPFKFMFSVSQPLLLLISAGCFVFAPQIHRRSSRRWSTLHCGKVYRYERSGACGPLLMISVKINISPSRDCGMEAHLLLRLRLGCR